MERRNEVSSYLENISLLLFGLLLFALPLVFTTATTDLFTIPKQALLAGVVLIGTLLFGGLMLSEGKVRLRRTPLDLPLVLLAFVAFISAVFSVNRADAFIAFIPLLLAITSYFLIVNVAKTVNSVSFLLNAWLLGASVAAVLGILAFFKVYPLPFVFTKTQTFTPLGTLLDHFIYLLLALPAAGYLASSVFRTKNVKDVEVKTLGFTFISVLLAVGILITGYEFLSLQKPLILPFQTGFQTAFAAISQDSGRIIQGFLFGSGLGTYVTDFTRFKQPSFNMDPTLWSFTFFRSSSYVLELLATTGILGLGAFIFLIVKAVKNTHLLATVKKNTVALTLIVGAIVACTLPFSFTIQTTFFLILALFAASAALLDSHRFFDIELHFVAFRKGLIPFSTSPQGEEKSFTKFLPVSFFILFALLVGIIGFLTVRYVASDVIFQRSLVAASANNGLETYNNQINAIQIFPYRDSYYRVYSQTNIALANSLAASIPQGGSPSAQVQQTITTFIQQAINAGRSATVLSPQTTLNWQNLSAVYRSLIGFGQNAESFAVAANQQAIVLDPNNPEEYINLGGIYYQLRDFDSAQRQFQIAVNLKPDFANAYYNLGHALEEKGDLRSALAQYQAVRTLVANDKDNLKRITEEIEALEKRIGTQLQAQTPQTQAPQGQQPPLELSTPSQTLPERDPKVELPSPTPQATDN